MSVSTLNNKKYKLAVVLPRYGKSLGGGAETLVKGLIEDSHHFGDFIQSVVVWTTCAKDHRTWKNELPEGESLEDGIEVSRFLVDDRNLDIFLKAEIAIADKLKLSAKDQLDWLANGVNSTGLYQHIAENAENVDFILFAPYLFSTSFWGALIEPNKTILLPCLHDEPYAYQSVFQAVFSKVKGIIFNSNAEQELAEEIFYKSDISKKSSIVGMGFENLIQSCDDSSKVKTVNKLSSNKSIEQFIIYSGRKEQGKNLDLLIEYYSAWRKKGSKTALSTSLVIIGAGEINFLKELPDGVIDLGFVSEADKIKLFTEATFLCQPSINESFSIVLMEAWSCSCPVVVNAECAVTREHVTESSGGLYFSDLKEFISVTENLLIDSALRDSLANSGKEYVENKYSRKAVIKRFKNSLDKFSSIDSANHKNTSKDISDDIITGIKASG